MKLVEKAQAKYRESRPDNEMFDPALLWVIQDVIESIVAALAMCRDANAATNMARNPTILQRNRVFAETRRKMGILNYLRYDGRDLAQSVLDAGKEATREDFEEAFMSI